MSSPRHLPLWSVETAWELLEPMEPMVAAVGSIELARA
jgi:hypothetical protein